MKVKLLVSALFSTLVISSGYSMNEKPIEYQKTIGNSIQSLNNININGNKNIYVNEEDEKMFMCDFDDNYIKELINNEGKKRGELVNIKKFIGLKSNLQIENDNLKEENNNLKKQFKNALSKPKNEIQMERVGELNINRVERPQNEIQNEVELNIDRVERPENVIEAIDEIEIVELERPENVPEQIDELEFGVLERPENVPEQVDEIQINANEIDANVLYQIDEVDEMDEIDENVIQNEIELNIDRVERPQNVIEEINANEGFSFKSIVSKYMKMIGDGINITTNKLIDITKSSIETIKFNFSSVKNVTTSNLSSIKETIISKLKFW